MIDELTEAEIDEILREKVRDSAHRRYMLNREKYKRRANCRYVFQREEILAKMRDKYFSDPEVRARKIRVAVEHKRQRS